MQSKTIIVGGGIAGISCALHLLEGGEEFTLITDDIGGRVSYSPQKDVNYGAYFIMSNYSYAKKQ